MVKIENLDEFQRILESKFGLLVISNKDGDLIHNASCENLDKDDFIESKSKGERTFNWFSTMSLLEKEFPNGRPCENCNPD